MANVIIGNTLATPIAIPTKVSQLENDEFEGYPGITYENGRKQHKASDKIADENKIERLHGFHRFCLSRVGQPPDHCCQNK